MSTASPATTERRAIGIDIDRPFQHVLAAWLSAHSYRVTFLPLAAAAVAGGCIELVVCELAEPKATGAQTLRQLADAHPDAKLIAISARFVAGPHCRALARQLGVHAALGKPFSRGELDTALDAGPAQRPPGHHGQA